MKKILTYQDAISDIVKEVSYDVVNRTVQIFAIGKENNSIPIPLASGILYKSGNQLFIISAGHIINGLDEKKLFIFINNSFISLNIKGSEWVNPQRSKMNDITDIVNIKIEEKYYSVIMSIKQCVTENEILFEHNLESTPKYLIVGFPSTYTKVNTQTKEIKPKSMNFWTVKKDDKWYNKLNYNREINYLVSYNRKKNRRFDNPNISKGPKPNGLSGSGLWYIPHFNIKRGAKIPFKLIGINTEFVSEHNIIVATKIDVVNYLFNLKR